MSNFLMTNIAAKNDGLSGINHSNAMYGIIFDNCYWLKISIDNDFLWWKTCAILCRVCLNNNNDPRIRYELAKTSKDARNELAKTSKDARNQLAKTSKDARNELAKTS